MNTQNLQEALSGLKAEQQNMKAAIGAIEGLLGKTPARRKARGKSPGVWLYRTGDAKAIRRALAEQGDKPPESWIKVRSKLLNGATKTAGALPERVKLRVGGFATIYPRRRGRPPKDKKKGGPRLHHHVMTPEMR